MPEHALCGLTYKETGAPRGHSPSRKPEPARPVDRPVRQWYAPHKLAPEPSHAPRQLDRRSLQAASLRPPGLSCPNTEWRPHRRWQRVERTRRQRPRDGVAHGVPVRCRNVRSTHPTTDPGIATASDRHPNRSRSDPLRTNTSRPRSCRKLGCHYAKRPQAPDPIPTRAIRPTSTSYCRRPRIWHPGLEEVPQNLREEVMREMACERKRDASPRNPMTQTPYRTCQLTRPNHRLASRQSKPSAFRDRSTARSIDRLEMACPPSRIHRPLWRECGMPLPND